MPGMCLEFTVTFSPISSNGVVEGSIMIVTSSKIEEHYRSFTVPITCIERLRCVLFSDTDLHFARVPIWKVGHVGINEKRRYVKVLDT